MSDQKSSGPSKAQIEAARKKAAASVAKKNEGAGTVIGGGEGYTFYAVPGDLSDDRRAECIARITAEGYELAEGATMVGVRGGAVYRLPTVVLQEVILPAQAAEIGERKKELKMKETAVTYG